MIRIQCIFVPSYHTVLGTRDLTYSDEYIAIIEIPS